MQRTLLILALWLALLCAAGAEKLPPPPARYFNDYAGVVSADTAATLDEKLRQFERDTSNQILVAVFPKMETESSIEDFTVRIAQSWKVGQKEQRNGAVLFVFVAERKMFLQVGYGLEGTLPDAMAKRIIENEIKPHFRAGNYDAGLAAGVEAIFKATRGEYRGTGRIAADARSGGGGWLVPLILIGFLLLPILFSRRKRGTVFNRQGRRGGGWLFFPSGGGLSGGGGGGGWSGGGGGGGFSGGGGSFGGGGAGGSW